MKIKAIQKIQRLIFLEYFMIYLCNCLRKAFVTVKFWFTFLR